MASYIEPLGLCDFCSKPFYENDFRLKQISNECANVFKLEFCGIDCLQAVEKDYMFVRLYEFQKTNEYNCVNEDEYNIIGAFLMNHRSFAFVCDNPTPIYDNPTDTNKNKIDLDSDYICLDFEDNKSKFKSSDKSTSKPRTRKTYDVINQYLTLKNSNIETLTKDQKKFLEFCDKHKLIK